MAGSFDRRAFLAGGAAAAAGAVALGGGVDLLSGGVAGAVTNGPGRNGASTAKPKKGGTLIFGVDAEEQGFNPYSGRFDEVGVSYARTVFDPLTVITETGGWAPYLAESVVPNADYTQWTVTLRPNLVFHDGTPCNGAAMLLNFQTALSAYLTGLALKPIVADFVQTGPLSVRWDLKSPWVPFPFYLAGGIGGQIAYLCAPAMLSSANGGTDRPIGTGPFVFKQWIPNDHFTATANPHYWRPGYPYLSSITFKPIPDSEARAEALQSGTINMMITDTPQQIVQFRGNHQWSYIDDSGKVIGEPDMNCVQLNVSKAPFNNPQVRLAAAQALSSKEYSKVIDIGVNAPSNGLFTPGSPYYSNPGYPSYNPSAARSLVKKVEHQTGKPVSFELVSTNAPSAIRAAQFLQQQFQSAGMKVSLGTVQQNDIINQALAGTYQAVEWRQFGAVNPDLNYIFWSTTTVSPSGISINMARNSDPTLEAALQTGRSSTDAETRAKAYKTVNERLAKDLPYLWNDRATWAVVAQPTVQNFNNPTTPSGAKAYGMIGGYIWPTQIWRS